MQKLSTERNEVEVFLKSWNVYHDIIKHNYMFHREISAAAQRYLVDFAPKRKLNILDLGCGDASMVLPLLSDTHVALYTGCDLSKPALDIARQQLTSRNISSKLVCDDMLKVISEQPNDSIDLIFSSYAIHHLNRNNKQALIKQICRVLTPIGIFLLIDIFRETYEDRATYMINYLEQIKSSWSYLSTQAQKLVIDHVAEHDFPEQPDFYKNFSQKYGLSHNQLLAKHKWHQAWMFSQESLDSNCS